MIWHIHRWGMWEDTSIQDKALVPSYPTTMLFSRQVIKQQRRCSICNLVVTRYSA